MYWHTVGCFEVQAGSLSVCELTNLVRIPSLSKEFLKSDSEHLRTKLSLMNIYPNVVEIKFNAAICWFN